MPSSSANLQTILFLAANPKDIGRLRLDQELRDIAEGLQRAQKRDQFNLEQRLAVRPRDVQRAMLDVRPRIIHFSGHGEGEAGLVFEDDIGNAKLVDGAALAGLFELFADQITCVVLNGCYSEVQAIAIAQHIPYVIGMNKAIGDKAAIAFAVGFYDALGAGRPIEFAYKLGCSAIRLECIVDHPMPVLLKQPIPTAAISPPQSDVMSQSTPPTSTIPSANVPVEVFISYSDKLPSQIHPPVTLNSICRVDYTRLQDLLQAQHWQAANQETEQVMLKAARRTQEGWLSSRSMHQFPLVDLKTINQLWLTYSRDHFGFSVQQRIFEHVQRLENRFMEQIAWERAALFGGVPFSSVATANLQFTLNAPKGHLPFVFGGEHGWIFERLDKA